MRLNDYGMTVSSMGDHFFFYFFFFFLGGGDVTVNARGLKQNMKRLAIFRYLKQHHYDVICLQETHLTKQDIPIWEKQWGGTIIYVEGTAHGQREMILISKKVHCEVNIIKQRSRHLVMHLKGEGIDVVIANVYAPKLKAEKHTQYFLI